MEPLVFSQVVSTGESSSVRRVMLADCPDYLTFSELAERLYSEYRYRLKKIDVLVVRPRVDKPIDDESTLSKDILPLLRRSPLSALHVLYSSGYAIKLSKNWNAESGVAGVATEDTELFLTWLRDMELRQFIERSRALYPPRKNWLYRTPNRKYANMFLRVGNVQRTRQALDSFFFWMLPYLKDVDSILSETWSVSSIALNSALLLDRYWSAYYQTEQQCRVDILSSYHDRRPSVLAETKDALHRVTNRPYQERTRRTLVMLSAVSTGNSANQLTRTIEEYYSRNEFRFLTLYKLTANTDLPALCDLTSGVNGTQFEVDLKPRVHQDNIIEIDPQVYFPSYGSEARALLLYKKHAKAAKTFFSAYQGLTAISLHRDAKDEGQQKIRHHGVYVDISALLSHPDFQQRLVNLVSRLPAVPTIVIAPPHSAARKLVESVHAYLIDKFGSEPSPQIWFHSDLASEIPRRTIASLGENELLLIIDDVCIKGWRLKQYQKTLRELEYKGRICYLVGVSRPPAQEDWKTLRDELASRVGYSKENWHLVLAVENIILPDWHEDECPWCSEQASLIEVLKKIQNVAVDTDQVAIAKRINILQRTGIEEGLVNQALWTLHPSKGPRLGPASLFLEPREPSQSDVLAAVFSTLQAFRNGSDERLDPEYPYATILSRANYLGERFNDIILRCAILRGAHAEELCYWRDRAERLRAQQAKARVLKDSSSDTLQLEFAVAVMAGKLRCSPFPMERLQSRYGAMRILRYAVQLT